MGKLSVLALALHSTVLGQSNDDEDLTPGASGDYELEFSGDQPIQSTTVAATVSVNNLRFVPDIIRLYSIYSTRTTQK